MVNLEERAIELLGAQIARAQGQLDESRPSSPVNFFSGLALGAVAGALLAFYFTREEAVPEDETPPDSAPILLRESAASPAPSVTPRPLVAMPTKAEEGVPDQLAAAELESPEAVKDIAKAAGEAVRSRVAPIDGACPASHPIKGNKSSMGALIYHTPASLSYARTKPEACFATEADAEAAGYRAPRG